MCGDVDVEDVQRALKDVSMTFEASCFPLPSFSFAFYVHPVSLVALEQREDMMSTEKSAALSFRFFALLGITCNDGASETNRYWQVQACSCMQSPNFAKTQACISSAMQRFKDVPEVGSCLSSTWSIILRRNPFIMIKTTYLHKLKRLLIQLEKRKLHKVHRELEAEHVFFIGCISLHTNHEFG